MGGTSTVQAASHHKIPLYRLEGHGQVHLLTTLPSLVAMGSGENGRWKMITGSHSPDSCIQAIQDIGRLMLNLEMTASLGSTLNDQEILSRDSTACSTRRVA